MQKFLTKYLQTKFNNTFKGSYTKNKWGLTKGCKDGSINMTHHINKIKDKNYIIFSIDTDRTFDKIQHPVMIKKKKNKKKQKKTPLSAKWYQFSFSVVSDSATPWTAAHQASLAITNTWSLLKLMSIESVMPSNHLILCHPLLLLPSIFPSIRVFSNESTLCMRRPKDWSFQLQHQSYQWTPRTDLL